MNSRRPVRSLRSKVRGRSSSLPQGQLSQGGSQPVAEEIEISQPVQSPQQAALMPIKSGITIQKNTSAGAQDSASANKPKMNPSGPERYLRSTVGDRSSSLAQSSQLDQGGEPLKQVQTSEPVLSTRAIKSANRKRRGNKNNKNKMPAIPKITSGAQDLASGKNVNKPNMNPSPVIFLRSTVRGRSSSLPQSSQLNQRGSQPVENSEISQPVQSPQHSAQLPMHSGVAIQRNTSNAQNLAPGDSIVPIDSDEQQGNIDYNDHAAADIRSFVVGTLNQIINGVQQQFVDWNRQKDSIPFYRNVAGSDEEVDEFEDQLRRQYSKIVSCYTRVITYFNDFSDTYDDRQSDSQENSNEIRASSSSTLSNHVEEREVLRRDEELSSRVANVKANDATSNVCKPAEKKKGKQDSTTFKTWHKEEWI